MTAINDLLCFLVWPLKRQQRALPCICLVGALPYSHYVMRSFLLRGVRVLHPAQYDLHNKSITITVTTEKNKKTVLWLSSSRSGWGMFYTVVADQRQPQYTHNGLQRRCQPRPTILYIKRGGRGRGAYSFVACPSRLTIDYASLSLETEQRPRLGYRKVPHFGDFFCNGSVSPARVIPLFLRGIKLSSRVVVVL